MKLAILGPEPWVVDRKLLWTTVQPKVEFTVFSADADVSTFSGFDGPFAVPVPSNDAATALNQLDDTFAGSIIHPNFSRAALTSADLLDGLASATSVVSTLAVQPTGGGSRMLIGFNSLTSSIARAVATDVGSALILGGREVAAAALAALIQLKAESVHSAPVNVAGPGSALAASHNLDLPLRAHRFEDVAGALDDFDTIVVAGKLPDALVEALNSAPSRIVDAVGLVARPSITYAEILARQVEDEVRILSGVNPDLEILRKTAKNL